ncbi:MAG: hypothetical protein HYU25_03965 [Candidatus Rokubacteria bacterium]|nr:hypothetical protein [Candidatus Rokubacteria bacterium]
MSGRIVQISVSPGGVPKTRVTAAPVTVWGLAGDAQRDTEHHGGPERAVCLQAMEAIRALQAEGHTVVPARLGENGTVEGLEWPSVVPGRRVYARVLATGSISDGDLVPLLTDAEAARPLTPART